MDELDDLREEWELDFPEVSPETKIVYLRGVRQFSSWLSGAHPDLDLEGIKSRHVHGWLKSMAGLSPATRRVRLISLKIFFDYLVKEPDIPMERNPAVGVDLPSVEVKPVPIVGDAELTRLLKTADGVSFIDRRDTAMLRLLIDTGCRRSELMGINLDDVDLHSQDVTLTKTKGSRPRIVPIGSKTVLALRRYLRARAKSPGSKSPALFIAVRESNGEWRLTGGAMAVMLNRRCGLAGMAPIHPHQLRHTWAHDQMANGAQETEVERLAGWRSPLMVRRYGLSAADERARNASRKRARGDRV